MNLSFLTMRTFFAKGSYTWKEPFCWNI